MSPFDQSKNGAVAVSPYIPRRTSVAPGAAAGGQDDEYIDSGQSSQTSQFSTSWESGERKDAPGHSSRACRMRQRMTVKPGMPRMADHQNILPNGYHGWMTYQAKLAEAINTLTDLAAKRDQALSLYVSSNEAYSAAVSEADDTVLFSEQWQVSRQASGLASAAEDAWNALIGIDDPAKNLIRSMVLNAEPDADPEEVKRELLDLYLGDYSTHQWYESFLQGL